jgi:hypothetical protein
MGFAKHLRPPVAVLDVLLILCLLTAIVIADTGGGIWRVAGIRVSTREPWNPLALAAAVLLVRVWAHGRTGPFGRPWPVVGRYLGLIEDAGRLTRAGVPGWREAGLALLALVGATVVIFPKQVLHFMSVPDLGDPLFSMWRIAWVTHQIVRDPGHLFDANIFYPLTSALTFSDSMILPALTAAPLLWAGVHPLVAYTLLFLSGFILSGVATYVLIRAWGLGRAAAWVGALVFAFYPFRIDHYSHLELQMAQWAPIVLLAVHRILSGGARAYLVVLPLAVAAQWYSSMYYGVFLMAYAGAFAAVLMLAWRPGWRRAGQVMAGLAVGAALAVPLVRAYSVSKPLRGDRPLDAIERFSAKPVDYLQPTHRNAVYGSFEPAERLSERELFPGFVPILCAIAGAVPPLTATRLAVLAAGGVALDGSLGLNGHWYPIAFRLFPPLKSVRAPARFAIFVGLSLAVLSAFGVERLWNRIRSDARRRLLVGVISAAFLVDVVPALELLPVWRKPPPIYAPLRASDRQVVLFEYPVHPNPDWFEENLPFMYFSMWHWHRMINGYSGSIPQSYRTIVEATAGFPGGNTVDYAARLGVTHVTVNCKLWDRFACRLFTERLERTGRFTLVRSVPGEGEDTRLYELRQ